jgi:Zn-dependent peptidase ImmA (M78 family)
MKTIRRKQNNFQNTRQKVKEVLEQVRAKYGISGNFTKSDFYRICKSENIRLIKSDAFYYKIKGIKGFIFKFKGQRFIYLRSFHHSRFDIATACHELGHYFLRHEGVNYKMMRDGVFSIEQNEVEADLFMALASGRGGAK